MGKNNQITFPMRNSLPKKIYYKGQHYKIVFSTELEDFGITDADTKTITIKSGLPPRETLSTLIHELLHVVELETPIKIKHKDVYKWERAIMEILMDNFL